MPSHIRNPLVYVWGFLTVTSMASWWISRTYDVNYLRSAAVTISVLLIAAIKTQLVIRYFMEVRFAPGWLKRCTYGLVSITFVLLLAFYYLGYPAVTPPSPVEIAP